MADEASEAQRLAGRQRARWPVIVLALVVALVVLDLLGVSLLLTAVGTVWRLSGLV